MTEFKIEKGVPLTARPTSSGVMNTLHAMEVGDSFLWPGKRSTLGPRLAALRPKKFATRTVEGGCRVWRIA